MFPQNLSSEVNICVPVMSNPSITFQEAQALIRERDNCIPLTELAPVFDETGDFDQTALALEHVRYIASYTMNYVGHTPISKSKHFFN